MWTCPFECCYIRDQVDDISPPCRLKQYTARYESGGGKVFRRLEDEEPTPPAAASAHAQSVSSKRESPPTVTEGGKLLVLGGDIDWRRPPSGPYVAHAGSRFDTVIRESLRFTNVRFREFNRQACEVMAFLKLRANHK